MNRQLVKALDKFEAIMAIDNYDKAAILHQQRCQYWLQNTLPKDWDGIETLTEK